MADSGGRGGGRGGYRGGGGGRGGGGRRYDGGRGGGDYRYDGGRGSGGPRYDGGQGGYDGGRGGGAARYDGGRGGGPRYDGGGRGGGGGGGGYRGGRGDGSGGWGRGGDRRDQRPPSLSQGTSFQSSFAPAPPSPSAPSLADDMERSLQLRPPSPPEASVPPADPFVEASTELPIRAPPASSKADRRALRPSFGTFGEKCMIKANHFIVQVADKGLDHYDVTITPETRSRAQNRFIMKELLNLYGDTHLGGKKPAYDGRKGIYTAGEMPFSSKDFSVTLIDKKGEAKKERAYTVSIKHVGKADMDQLHRFLAGKQLDMPQDTIQALDVVMRESPSMKYTTVARSFFSPNFETKSDIGEGLECWRGYYQSLRPTQMGLSLNIDMCATSFYKPVPVTQFVLQFLGIRGFRPQLSDQERVRVKKALKGLRVETFHNEVHRRYKVSGISSMPLIQLTFSVGDSETPISVAQYFQERYNYNLENVNWPCIQAGTDTKPIYLPMEVCRIVEGQRYSKKLNERQVTQILRAACERPNLREENILKMVQKNDYSNDSYSKEFAITVSNQLTTLDARVLPPPTLKYYGSGKDSVCNPRSGTWNMIGKKMVNGGTVANWTCVSFSSKASRQQVNEFCYGLVRMCINIGMAFNENPLINFHFPRVNDLDAALREIHRQACTTLENQGKSGEHLQMLFVVLPDISGSYGKIKRLCETELGIVTQCCLPKHVFQAKGQYLENVALKVNVKVGGRNTVLEDAINRRIPLVTDKPTIIFGADVTHPSPGEDSSASIAAVVASMDWPEITKYRGLVSAQPHREEIIKDLFSSKEDPKRGIVVGGMIRELLISFRRETGRRPERIIFYRDGVSEGQFNQVLMYEMDAIRKACASLEEGYLPPVTFVVVQKRHHTRLFPMHNSRHVDRSGNVTAGTVVDRGICHPTEFDFYLCSHAGIQGTSRPTHYHVLYDENFFPADGLQTLTNNLCYTYARCTKSVSVVPPAYYAHLAAFRARYYVDGDVEGSSGDASARRNNLEVHPLPTIKDTVKNVMFYC